MILALQRDYSEHFGSVIGDDVTSLLSIPLHSQCRSLHLGEVYTVYTNTKYPQYLEHLNHRYQTITVIPVETFRVRNMYVYIAAQHFGVEHD